MSFDPLAFAAALIVLTLGAMRLLYGAWPWEARKTWYHTRPAVEYLAALRRAQRDRELGQLENSFKAANDRFAGSVTPLRQVAGDASVDHFDRSSMSTVIRCLRRQHYLRFHLPRAACGRCTPTPPPDSDLSSASPKSTA